MGAPRIALRRFSDSPSGKASEPITEASVESPKRPLTFGRFLLYAIGASSASIFCYYFYQAGGNLHTTEIMIGRRLAQLPLYYPPGPPVSERNAALPQTPELSQTIVDQLSAWFISNDAAAKDGLIREDVLELLSEKFGVIDNDKPESAFPNEMQRTALKAAVDKFIEKGRGRLTEYKRQSGVSLQESLELLNEVIRIHKEHTTDVESVLNRVSATLYDELDKLMSMPLPTPSLTPQLPDIEDIDEQEVLKMELSQLERSREEMSRNKQSLSEAELERLSAIEAQIVQLRSLLAA